MERNESRLAELSGNKGNGNRKWRDEKQQSNSQYQPKPQEVGHTKCDYCGKTGHEAHICFANPSSPSFVGKRGNTDKYNKGKGQPSKSSAISSIVLKTAEIEDAENSQLMSRIVGEVSVCKG
jgi:hypothetical protein